MDCTLDDQTSIICLSAVYMHSTCACIFLGVTLYRNKFFVKTTVHVHVNLHAIEAFIVTHVHMYKINIHVHVYMYMYVKSAKPSIC